ncbi:MAG: hypothetical protein ACRDJK_11460 [Actinomycetota bacterium]
MMGCLTAPFKLLGCLGLIAVLLIGWIYRDRLEYEGRKLLDQLRTAAPDILGGLPAKVTVYGAARA